MQGIIITDSGTGSASLAANQSQFKIKVTSFDGNSIGGRAISLKDTAGNTTNVTTDTDGTAEVILVPGTYTVTCDAPSSYEAPSAQTLTVKGATSYDVEFHLYSNVNPVTVKLASFDNAGISGCKLRVTPSSGTATEYTFAANGTLNLNLASGTYTFAITGNSARYVTPATQTKTLARGASTTLNFTLATNVGTINVTVTSFNGSGISGTTLTMKKSDGTVVDTYTMTAAGTRTIDLNPGTYTISLSGIKDGYDEVAPQTITVARGTTYNVSMFIPERSTFIYGVRITKSNSSPTHVTYTDDAAGLNPSTMSSTGVLTDNGWNARLKELFGLRPCVLKNGVVQYYLNETNFNKKADGSASVLTGADGDVMIEFTRNGWVSITNDSSYVYVRISNTQVDSTYQQLAFSYKGTVRNKFYIGVYLADLDSNKLRSRSGVSPLTNKSITDFIGYAHAAGTGYELVNHYKWTLLQVLYLIRFKSLDGQTAVGKGYTGASAKVNTGGTNAQGMNYGTTTNNNATTGRVKVNGIEDMWGNCLWWIDGLFCDSSRNIRTGDIDVVSAGNGTSYTTRATISSNIGGYISDVHGTNELGFLIKASSGSDSTYYCDNGDCYAGCVGYAGGAWPNGLAAGPFRLNVYFSLSGAFDAIGGRLAWCGA
ncbi:MAG: carboxypeptidase-like regulatory domain-containing protein [Lachnospiraceae bacterium]|nr:carboxypeptidase-like regulatory domain-containing protein [Lachnospiraceae bacterium]